MILEDKQIYIASGWFSDEQMEACVELENFASFASRKFFAPRLMNLGDDGCDWKTVFDKNIEELEKAEIVLCSTVGKDMGAIFEAGYAHARGIRVIYYTPGIKKPNLMLGLSGQIATTHSELIQCYQDPNETFASKDFE